MNKACGRGPLAGIRIVEFTGLGPAPHAVMLLSDMGAEVLRIERPEGSMWPNPILDRGRHVLHADIRSGSGLALATEAVEHADVLVEGYRPGVMERLGLGPNVFRAKNPRLIYARMTGWGQSGPLSKIAGHDINYVALTGALRAITDPDGNPIPSLNLVGDFGGGSLYLALGVAAALFERERSGLGQVVDAAIVDGVASIMAMLTGLAASNLNSLEPKDNLIGGNAPFYRCYECADGKYVAVGAVEPHFYSALLDRIGADESARLRQNDPATWPGRVRMFAGLFKQKTRDEWCALAQDTDACLSPVLTYAESLENAHLKERATYVEADGLEQVAPAPRFSRTPGTIGPDGEGLAMLQRWRCN